MKALGAVCEEPVITIGVDGETLDECENDEESYIPVSECDSHKVIKTRWIDTNKGDERLQKFVAGWWRKR